MDMGTSKKPIGGVKSLSLLSSHSSPMLRMTMMVLINLLWRYFLCAAT